MSFNTNKTQAMLISRKNPKTPQLLNIYLNNGRIRQTESMKYLGILIDKRFRFAQHVEYITDKSIALVHALAKSAKINWGLNSDVTKILYKGAILPILSYGIPVWIEALRSQHNIRKHKRVQRMINIKIAKAFRTTSHEALCILTGMTPIVYELTAISKFYSVTKGRIGDTEGNPSLDTPVNYRDWPHPSLIVKVVEKSEEEYYSVQIYTDGSKTDKGVGAGVVIYHQEGATQELRFRLGSRCSNNQAEQVAILRALEALRNYNTPIKSAAIHTDSKITLDLISNNSSHCFLIEEIRQNLQILAQQTWKIHFQWVKAHAGNEGNERADQLAKQAAGCLQLQPTFELVPFSTVKRDLREEANNAWDEEWSTTTNGGTTKSYFPTVRSRQQSNIKLTHNITAVTTGHGKFGEYFYRFRISDDPTCVCGVTSQTVDHILWECSLLQNDREAFRRQLLTSGRQWPPNKSDLVLKHLKEFKNFVNSINFDKIQTVN